MPLRRNARLLIAVVASAIALAVATPAIAQPAPGHGNPHRLHLDGATLRDGRDRQVLLRGVAVIEKSGNRLPRVDATDFARIRSWGLNSIRLGVFWENTMPERGVIDHDYVAAVGDLVDLATEAGLYVILDMHQDVWGHPHGAGAPLWATDTTCPDVNWASYTGSWATNYFSPATACAFTNFWLDTDLQSLYGQAWQALAAEVGRNPFVAGYDLMNEPYQGMIPNGVFETQVLYPAQRGWIEAIREVDPDGIGFFETPNAKNVHLPTVPPTDLPDGVVYAPHLYGLWDAADELSDTRALAEANFDYSRTEAETVGIPLWIGEWGVRADSPGATDFVTQVLDWADEALAGSSYWEYDPGNGYSPVDADGTGRPLLGALVRAYPRAVPGSIDSFHYDAATRSFTLSVTTDTDGVATVAAPRLLYPDGVVVDGVTGWTFDAEDDALSLRLEPGSQVVTVTARS